MLFNSFAFLIFFSFVFVLYYAISHRYRWMLLLISSATFYMWLIPSYILILALTILVDYLAGIQIEQTQDAKLKKIYLWISIVSTCAILFAFKYLDFAIEQLGLVGNLFGYNSELQPFKWALPIGLSFHTFQSLSYVIEVYRGNQKAEKHFGIYSLYVLFFPQLVAGPIERPQTLLGQFRKPVIFNYDEVCSGIRLVAWGLFKKVVVADRAGKYVNFAYSYHQFNHGPWMVIAAFLFAFQIYADFSGYTDMARGIARMLGFKLSLNFQRPYFASSISEFWSRWHISLSTWFRDYVYIPLGGNRGPFWRTQINILITFALSGLWHGAKWTFVIWGLLNGIYLIAANIKNKFNLPTLWKPLRVFSVFFLITLSWIYFRSPNLDVAHAVLGSVLDGLTSQPEEGWEEFFVALSEQKEFLMAISGIFIMLFVETLIEKKWLQGSIIPKWSPWLRWSLYLGTAMLILALGKFDGGNFIYFQF